MDALSVILYNNLVNFNHRSNYYFPTVKSLPVYDADNRFCVGGVFDRLVIPPGLFQIELIQGGGFARPRVTAPVTQQMRLD